MDFDDLQKEVFGDDENGGLQGSIPPAVLALMATLQLGTPITGDEVSFHDDAQIVLPKGMTFERAAEIFERLKEEQETVVDFTQQFFYRPDDGAVATAEVLSRLFGMTVGEEIDMGFFGKRRPESRSVKISATKTVQVPWGLISIPSLEGVRITLCGHHVHELYGQIFDLHVEAPRKFKPQIEAIFAAIEEELQVNSIYRGKALVGVNDLEFLDLTEFIESKYKEIVFSDDVLDKLETVWAPIRYTAALEAEGARLKRSALLFGPYGTGKSSAGLLTAKLALENGWTFISARTGVDQIEDVLRFARMYMPAVVFVEDVDGQTSSDDATEVALGLEAFDGITAKGGKLILIVTSNHEEKIHRGFLRPGRLDAVIKVAGLDQNGAERLIKAVVAPDKLDPAIDYIKLYEAMDGYTPAFVREVADRAKLFAISRLKGDRNYVLGTEDLISAALSLRDQFELLTEAGEGIPRSGIDGALGAMVHEQVRQAVDGFRVDFNRDVLRRPDGK